MDSEDIPDDSDAQSFQEIVPYVKFFGGFAVVLELAQVRLEGSGCRREYLVSVMSKCVGVRKLLNSRRLRGDRGTGSLVR